MAAGVTSDTRGFWAVDCVLEWRGGGADREALVRWTGFDASDATASTWRESWVPRNRLSKDLRELGRIRPYRKRMARSEAAETEATETEAARAAKGQRVSPRLAGVVPVAGLEGARRQATMQADGDQRTKRARASDASGDGMQLRKRVVTQEGVSARGQGAQHEQATAKAAGKRPMRAVVEEVTGVTRASCRGGEGGGEPQRQRRQTAQQRGGALEAGTSDVNPKRALATLRGDGRRVKTLRSSPSLAGEAPLSGRPDGQAEAVAAAEPRRRGHKRGGEAGAAHHGRQLRQRANGT